MWVCTKQDRSELIYDISGLIFVDLNGRVFTCSYMHWNIEPWLHYASMRYGCFSASSRSFLVIYYTHQSLFMTLRLSCTKLWWDPLVEPFREDFPWSILLCVIIRFNDESIEDPIRSVEDFISPLLETYRLSLLIIMMAGAFIMWW